MILLQFPIRLFVMLGRATSIEYPLISLLLPSVPSAGGKDAVTVYQVDGDTGEYKELGCAADPRPSRVRSCRVRGERFD